MKKRSGGGSLIIILFLAFVAHRQEVVADEGPSPELAASRFQVTAGQLEGKGEFNEAIDQLSLCIKSCQSVSSTMCKTQEISCLIDRQNIWSKKGDFDHVAQDAKEAIKRQELLLAENPADRNMQETLYLEWLGLANADIQIHSCKDATNAYQAAYKVRPSTSLSYKWAEIALKCQGDKAAIAILDKGIGDQAASDKASGKSTVYDNLYSLQAKLFYETGACDEMALDDAIACKKWGGDNNPKFASFCNPHPNLLECQKHSAEAKIKKAEKEGEQTAGVAGPGSKETSPE